MTKSIKLIALDMDGTLLKDDQTVSEPTKEMIKKALDKGIHVVLSTGRSIETCYPYAEALNLSSYLITANGGEIYTMEKELLDQHLLPTKIIESMWTLGLETGVDMWMIATDGVYRNDTPPKNFTDHRWLKFGCNTSDQTKLDLMIKELSHMDGLELTNSLPTNVEANPAGVSKAAALHFLCERMGITMEEVMAVGDSLNDIKMIQASGVGVAMGNAQEAIKNVADFVTDTNNNNGVAKAIEHVVL
jgi:hydroxymethylpyrimidine pyrophosphatase-like HAD family hydrolase